MLRKLLPLLFLLLPATARADWYEASTQHFVVYSDQRPEKIREFTANLERFDMVLPEAIWITGALVGFSIGKRNVG